MNRKTSLERNANTRSRDNKLVDRKPLAEVTAINKASKSLLKIDNRNNSISINSSGDSTGNINIAANGRSTVYVYTTNKSVLENEIAMLKEIIKAKDEIIEMLKKNVSIKFESE